MQKPIKATRAHLMAQENTKAKLNYEKDSASQMAALNEFKMKRFADVQSKIDNKRAGASSAMAAAAAAPVDVSKVRPAEEQ